MLVVMTERGRPAPRAAILAGCYPSPEATTLPRITSSTWLGSIPFEARAALIVSEESSVAFNPLSLPRKDPTGVLFAATM